jgi:hypothetical protein
MGSESANVSLYDGLRYVSFVVLPDRVAAKSDGTSRLDAQYALDGTIWHQYRFTLKGSTYACYVDESPVPAFVGTAYPTSVNRMIFGANGSQETQSIEFDYVLYKTTGATLPPLDGDSVSGVKSKPDGSSVSLAGVVVTACFSTFLYVADPDQAAGIRVVKPGHGASEGQWADVKGIIYTTAAGERYIDSTSLVLR